MLYKSLGKNGPKVSPISMGSSMEKVNTRELETARKTMIETLKYGIDSGINFLNTADFYQMGMNELMIGEAIKDRRDKVFLSVKTGSLRDPKGSFMGFDGRPKAIKNFCAYSLTRLGVNEIDLYQPARIDPEVPIEDTVGAIKDLIDEGKVRYLGISEANAEQLKRANKVHTVSALEIEYSLATRFIENEILPTARKLGTSIVAYSVLSYGLLTGNLSVPLAQDNYLKNFPRFQGDNLKHNLQKVEFLKNMANDKNVSASQLAIAWVLKQGEDIIPIVGMSKPTRVEQNLKALEIDFTPEEVNALNKTFGLDAMEGKRYPEPLMKIVAS